MTRHIAYFGSNCVHARHQVFFVDCGMPAVEKVEKGVGRDGVANPGRSDLISRDASCQVFLEFGSGCCLSFHHIVVLYPKLLRLSR